MNKYFIIGTHELDQFNHQDDDLTKPTEFNLPSTTQILKIKTGSCHSAILTCDNELLTFGLNDDGALGRPQDDLNPSIPKKISLNIKVKDMSLGDSHTLILTSTNKLYFTGVFRDSNNLMDQAIYEPKLIPTKGIISKILSGKNHALFLSSGIVYTFGDSETGVLGRISRSYHKNIQRYLTPEPLNFKKVQNIFTGGLHSFLQHHNGNIYGFGLNNFGQLGIPVSKSNNIIIKPILIESLQDHQVVDIKGGNFHTIAILNNNQIYSTGKNEENQLGIVIENQYIDQFTQIKSLENIKIKQINCSSFYNYAQDTDLNHYSWGAPYDFVLGDQQDDENICEPKKLDIMQGYQTACGNNFVIFFKQNQNQNQIQEQEQQQDKQYQDKDIQDNNIDIDIDIQDKDKQNIDIQDKNIDIDIDIQDKQNIDIQDNDKQNIDIQDKNNQSYQQMNENNLQSPQNKQIQSSYQNQQQNQIEQTQQNNSAQKELKLDLIDLGNNQIKKQVEKRF